MIHLRILNLILPFLPNFLIKTGFKKIVKWLQLGEKQFIGDYVPDLDPELLLLHKYFSKEFFKKCLTKTLLKTEIRLVNDFYENEKFKVEDPRDWQEKILILRTNNDPLANDDGQFKILYPNAEVYTFNNTSHLTFYYQFDKMVKIIRGFLKKKLTLSKTDPHLHLNLNICSGWKISIIHTRRGQPSKKIISTCYRWSQPGQGLDKLINN